jgi:hypothetical protein
MNAIGFDFSCNKPACCLQINNKFHFALWPLELDEKSMKMLSDVDVYVDNRQRLLIGLTSSEKFRWHVSMSNDLCNKILEFIKENIINDDKTIIAFEGSSYGSKGDAGLQLSGYRYILMNELGKLYGLENMYTYAPLTIKSMAGCATKDKKGKNSMIEAFKNENINHKFCRTLRDTPEKLKKKINYISGIDDCVDSYFTLKTLKIKENI